jgi:hypothetical protein
MAEHRPENFPVSEMASMYPIWWSISAIPKTSFPSSKQKCPKFYICVKLDIFLT